VVEIIPRLEQTTPATFLKASRYRACPSVCLPSFKKEGIFALCRMADYSELKIICAIETQSAGL
jgi:hypothetical protein